MRQEPLIVNNIYAPNFIMFICTIHKRSQTKTEGLFVIPSMNGCLIRRFTSCSCLGSLGQNVETFVYGAPLY